MALGFLNLEFRRVINSDGSSSESVFFLSSAFCALIYLPCALPIMLDPKGDLRNKIGLNSTGDTKYEKREKETTVN